MNTGFQLYSKKQQKIKINMKHNNSVPSDGWKGLLENWKTDIQSGFIIALLALPLSLGIASASDFPNPLYGVLTAIIGGILVSLFMGARLTIKGPAAGLIVIVAGSMSVLGWETTLAAIVIAALLQIAFGFLKLGKLSDFFPLSAVHGMLAAIGIIIMSKQLHVLMGVNPVFPEGTMHHGLDVSNKPMVAPLDLFGALGSTFSKLMSNPVSQHSFIIGVICLIIVFGWPMLKSAALKKIPAPMIVLLVSIPLAHYFGLSQENKQLVKVGDFWSILHINANFGHIGEHVGAFIQYVALFAIIGSLESLLTAKAIDLLDPFRRKTDFNKDLIAVGTGNALSGILGGLPMISEVARSSANVNNGAKTRWSNFFHGIFLFLFVALLSGVIEMIPKSALAALLIGVGFKLAHPREFIHMFKIGKEQLLIFLVTIAFTLIEDLLVGIAAGIVTKFIILMVNGAKFSNLFKPSVDLKTEGDRVILSIHKAAIFSNFLGIKSKLDAIPAGKNLEINVVDSQLLDHSSMEQLHMFEENYVHEGGKVTWVGLELFKPFSDHSLAARKKLA